MSSIKRQKTLGFFGFSKTVTHRGKKVKVDIPDDARDTSKNVTCPTCEKKFINNQGLGVHKLSCGDTRDQTSNAKLVHTSGVSDDEKIAQSVLNYLIGMVESADAQIPSKKVKSTKGSHVRKAHTAEFKAKVIHQIQPNVSQDEIARKYGISQSLVSKWVKDKDNIILASTDKHKKLYKKQRKAVKYLELYRELFDKMKEARGKGRKVNFNWLWTKARSIHREQTGDDAAVVRKHVVTTFLRRYNIRMRARQRNRRLPKEAYREGLMKWHSVTRERLVRTGAGDDSFDNKWGRFLPNQRFNVDQTPMPFVVDSKKTYEIITPGDMYHKTWISQSSSGLEKRQCTIQVCTRAEGQQPRIAIIFRGKGKRVRPDEKAAWHPNVDVFWQENAWADTKFSVDWVNSTLKSSVEDLDRHVLYVDNLTAQQTDNFKDAVSDLSGVAWYGLKNATDLWQVVDAGIAQTLKVLSGHNYQKWLDEGDNVDSWFGHENTLSAMQRRILITHWVGDAWETLSGPEYDHMRRRCWERTGCLMTADGSEDGKVTPEGLPNYKIPPPLLYLPTCEANPVSNAPDAPNDDNNEDHDEETLEDDMEEPEDEGEEWLDNESDRTYDDELCGRTVNGLYADGWTTGVIEYFNTTMNKYHVNYSDHTEDYIGVEDIDGVEIVLVD